MWVAGCNPLCSELRKKRNTNSQLSASDMQWMTGLKTKTPVHFYITLSTVYETDIFLFFAHSVPRLAACTSTVALWTSMRTRGLALCLRSGWLCPACWSSAGRSSSRPFLTWLHSPPCSCSTWASLRNSLNAWNRPPAQWKMDEWMDGWDGLGWIGRRRQSTGINLQRKFSGKCPLPPPPNVAPP